jgi:hypothetical protein
MTFTSKKDTSKAIFIPAAGWATDGSIFNSGSGGLVWSSMLSASNVTYGIGFEFNSSGVYLNENGCYHGYSVRGVIG